MKVYDNICELIGNTPILRLNKIEKKLDMANKIYAKLEKFNPGGSSKDRVAYQMIKRGIEEKKINNKTTIIEATSGNTGIGLAMVCAVYDLRLIIVMSDTATIERQKLLKLYGANVVLTNGKDGIEGAMKEAKRLSEVIENTYYVNQFNNVDNPNSHYLTTASEILLDLGADIDYIFVGMGSSGTITGIAKKIKEVNKNTKIIGIEPKNCAYYSKKEKGICKIPGIGTTFLPDIVDLKIIDDFEEVDEGDAISKMSKLAKEEGILVGISSGAVLEGAISYLKRKRIMDKKVLLLFPDTGERYLSIV